mmetsp:Transcript_90676/g.234139  ORF Transcript_90676/g.234139 Transcript_90676/m.234139 type:complete len:385 (+) Transcript_90676:176-1330(+)
MADRIFLMLPQSCISFRIHGRNLATIFALSSERSRPLAFAIDARVSGDMLFIMASVALSMSGSLNMAEGSMPAISGIPAGPPGPPAPPPLIRELKFIICSSCSGGMFFIISDICLVRSGLEAICSAALRIISASSGLLMLSFLRSSLLICFVISTAFFIMSGFSKSLLIADGSPPGKPPPPPALTRCCRSFLRSSSGSDLRFSVAALSMSGFFCNISIWLFIIAGSMPGGKGAFAIMACSSSGESLDMASVASLSMSGFSAIFSAACFQCSSPCPEVAGRLLLLVARLPLEDPAPVEAQAAETSCCVLRRRSSSMPFSFRTPRSRESSAAMALSEGESSAACRTSATASCRVPSSARAWPRRKSALKLFGSMPKAWSAASTALS